MMNIKKYIPIMMIFFALGCNSKNNHSKTNLFNKVEPKIKKALPTDSFKRSVDSIKKFIKKDAEIDSLEIKKDTLIIISGLRSLFYPFGKYSTYNELQKHLKIFKCTIESDSDKNKFYRMTFNNSYLKFYFDNEERNSFEMIYSEIKDPEITLNNGIKIGTKMNDFTKLYFTSNMQSRLKGIGIVKIVSSLDGVYQYFYFDKGILVLIRLDSDYLFNKF